MRARTVLIAALCGAALLAAACQQQAEPDDAGTAGDSTRASPSTNVPTGTPSTGPGMSEESAGAAPTTVPTVFDRQEMQTSVLRLLAERYGITGIEEVSCPSGEEVVDGNTFQCAAVIDGQERAVTITVRGSDGEYVVSRPR